MKRKHLGEIWGIAVTVDSSALMGSVFLWLAHTALALLLLKAPLTEALVAGFLAVPLFWFGDFVHQLGHAWVGRRVGYPMKEIRFRGFLIVTPYPSNEPKLPARLHIRRALGGPPVSLALSVVALVIVLIARNALTGPFWVLSILFFIQNFFIFFLGAFLPLGFTDGSTLLRYARQRDE